MLRPRTLLVIAAMLVVAGASPGLLTTYSPVGSSQNGMGASAAAFSTNWCLNCSDVASTSGVVSVAFQSPTPSFPSTSSYMASAVTGSLDEQAEAWVWRGKLRSRWESLGFDSGIFEMFMSMKGAKTRLNLLLALSEPKDRMRLAQELGLDWRAVDYQVTRLARRGLVDEEHVVGKVKLFRVTKLGEALLGLLQQEFDAVSGS